LLHQKKKKNVKSTISQHSNIYKYIWTSPCGKADCVITAERQTEGYLMSNLSKGLNVILTTIWVLQVRKQLSVSKQQCKSLLLKDLNDVEMKEQYEVKISNRYAALGNLDDNVNIDRTWKVSEYINFG
jgi:hypothetical protein